MKDHFSERSGLYARYRPSYPGAMFDFIMQHLQQRVAAWDCATGNGQAARMLAGYFRDVYATDISHQQVEQAGKSENIHYSIQPAEQTSFDDNSFDLVTAATAIHWFDFAGFYAEVKRTGRPGSVIAVWTYALFQVNPLIDQLVAEYYNNTINEYWEPERRYVDDHYASIPFPFEEICTPVFENELYWTAGELEGYLGTWSAVTKYVRANGESPVPALMEQIKPHWGSGKQKILFPIYMRMGKIK